jgi:hypothetical protein
MKKSYFFKFFVFALVGALVLLPSCKDYDDDINNLQDQIEKLASKDELTSQLSTLQAALTAAQTTASNAATKADQALTAAQAALAEAEAVGDAALTEAAVKALAQAEADAAAAAAKAEVLTELAAEIEALKAELAAANEAEFDAIKAELNTKIDEIAEKAENALGLIAGAVFDVEIVSSLNGNNEIPGLVSSLNFSSATEKDNVFEENIANAITFVKDNQVQTGTSFIIRVSPTNVIVTPEMVTLQNSMGVTYDNVKVTKVVPYEGLLTRSTANGGGLWEVFVELENYNAAAFKAATEKGANKVLFAVAVNNTDEEAPSKVISSYDIDLKWSAYTPADELFFFVGDKHVKDVNNRYANTSISLGKPGSGTVYAEKTWSGDPAVAITTSPANTKAAATDNRSGKDVYPAVQGQALKISLTKALDDAAVTKPTNIRGLYVTLDKDNAIDSAPSELNAWNSYSYTGLNTVVEGTEAEIIINSSTAINDIIGFRVYAVNFDGTLVDPDGKAFYVSLGKEATNWSAANTVVTATQQTPGTVKLTKSATTNVTLSKLSGATTFTWTTDKAELGATTTPAFNAYFVDANNNVLFNTETAPGTVASADFSKVTKVYTQATVANWLAYKDNKVYNGKLTIKNATGHVLATLDVTFKKVLPTALEGFSVKTNQVVNGVYNAYLEPDDWTAPKATTGTMPLDQVFNWGTGTLGNYETAFATTDITGPSPATATFTGNGPLSVDKSLINNTTQHATTVSYNFGKISTETKNSAGTVIDYKVVVEQFQTVYNNIYNSTYSWNWATRAQLNTWAAKPATVADYTATGTDGAFVHPMPYSTEITYGDDKKIDLGWIYGVSTRDSKYNANLDAPYKGSLQVTGMKLVSNANNLDEYYEVVPPFAVGNTTFTLSPKSTATNPDADVPSTLIISAKDMYDNDVEIKLPMTVKKR